MNIQKASSVNFGATRVLSITKGKSVTDVYRLDQKNINDISFIKRCKDTLQKRPEESRIAMKNFFKAFLGDRKFNREKADYYIAIKNDETILGGFGAWLNKGNSTMVFSKFINNNFSQESRDVLAYSLLTESQKHNPNRNIFDISGYKQVLAPYTNSTITKSNEIDNIKKQIELKYSDQNIESNNENVDLERIMGINHFEHKILM